MSSREPRVLRRFGRGWPERDLRVLLDGVTERPRTFPESSFEEMVPAAGWQRRLSRAEVAREPPGPPGPVFRRLAEAVEAYEFSDPTIVRGFFRSDGALLGRRMLLELRTVGVRFLCPVVVSRVLRESGGRASAVGFRYDTLEGHVEDGAEWFVLTKDHATGRILFAIDARWRAGALPTWWMRLGFPVLAPRSQTVWHRRAHGRLHALAEDAGAPPDGARGRAVRGGVGTGPAAAALGALTGLRSTASFYSLARHLTPVRASAGAGVRAPAGDPAEGAPGDPRAGGPGSGSGAGAGNGPGGPAVARLLRRPEAVPVLSLALAGEMAADKWPSIPARTAPPALAGRLAMAGLAGWVLARQRRRPPLRAGLLAAVSAGAVATGATLLRRRAGGKLPGAVLGLAEDVLVLAGGEALARRLGGPQPVEERDETGAEARDGAG